MDSTLLIGSSLTMITIILLAFKLVLHAGTQRKNLPPSPPSLPILGHLHLLINQPLHHAIHNLAQKYGPIISLRLGSRFVLVLTSPSAVQECFTKNDIVFANRPPTLITKILHYNSTSLVAAPYGEHWRKLRRLGALHIFSSTCLDKFSATRKDEIKILLRRLYAVSCNDFVEVGLRPMLSELTFNVIMIMMAGKRYHGENETGVEESRQFLETINEIFECVAPTYLGDYLPFLQWIGYRGFPKKMKKLSERVDRFFQGMIDEHRRDGNGGLEKQNTMIGHLLSLGESQSEYYTDETIKGLMLTLIFAATDTTAITLEWGMSYLLNHPEVLEKAQKEIDTGVGKQVLMEESHLSKLPFLANIISETLRLSPPGPLLLPHFSYDDCVVGGYHIPKNTMLLVNAWAIHRDPSLWADASKFKPERFDDGQGIEAHGLMPFGLGRRACPGIGLANRVLGLTLGSMIQCFDWKRVGEEEIDMTEGTGLTAPKAQPLVVLCKSRCSIMAHNVLSSLN